MAYYDILQLQFVTDLLLTAISTGNTGTAKYVLQNWPISSAIQSRTGDSFLHVAVKMNRLKMLKLFITESGVDINRRNFFDETPLFSAVRKSNFKAARELLNAGADINMTNTHLEDTALHLAIKKDDFKIMDLLLSYNNIDVDKTNGRLLTPLYLAGIKGNFRVVKRLVRAGANINLACSIYKLKPIQYCSDHFKILRFLIASNADLTGLDYNFHMPLLHKAVKKKDLNMLCLLLYYNYDALIQYRYGQNAFQFALQNGTPQIQYHLYNHASDSINENSIFDLRLALKHESPYANSLIERGVKINQNTLITYLENCYFNASLFEKLWGNVVFEDTDPPLFNVLFNVIVNMPRYIKVILNHPHTETLLLKHIYCLCNSFDCFISYLNLPSKENYEIMERLIYLLMEYSYEITARDISHLYFFCGLCPIVKKLRYLVFNSPSFDEDINYQKLIMPRLIFDMQNSVHAIKQKYENATTPELIRLSQYKRDFEKYIALFQERNLMTADEELAKVPKLTQLARDKSRDFIIDRFNILSPYKYYTTLDGLWIPKIVKQILKYEIKLYYD